VVILSIAKVDFEAKIWDAESIKTVGSNYWLEDSSVVETWLLGRSEFNVISFVRLFPITTICLTFLMGSAVYGQTRSPQVLQLQCDLEPLAAGVDGLLNINLVIKEGFKIPKRPAPRIKISSPPQFEVKGDLNFLEEGKSKDPEYFNGFKPLTLHIKPASTTKPGKYSLGGEFVYFYCSEKDKYCSRTAENLQIPLEVVAKE
jgi:hypothetical protein